MAQFKLRKIKFAPLGFVDSRWFYRVLEIIPGLATWGTIIGVFLLSLYVPIAIAYFIIAFDLLWFLKSIRMSWYQIRAYRYYKTAMHIDWADRLSELNALDEALLKSQKKLKNAPRSSLLSYLSFNKAKIKQYRANRALYDHVAELQLLNMRAQTIIPPGDIYHAVIIATYNESLDILRPSIEALREVDFDHKKLIVILAYEQRGGEQTERNALTLQKEFNKQFYDFIIVKHPKDLPDELPTGKGPNITYAGKYFQKYVQDHKLDPENIVVTTLDSDHRVDRQYFNYLTYAYTTDANHRHKSFQPIPMFFNNIWDCPAPMRVIATGNSFWTMIEMVRPHRLRNFAAHAQGMATLIDTDFWSVHTIVEDGHQYWRTFFTYDGDHTVEPLFIPIYQDAVLSNNYRKTIIAQFKQLQRWAWGVSDFAFVVKHSLKNNRIPLGKKLVSIGRLFEGHYSWATAPIILTFVAWVPLLVNQDFATLVIAHQLPVIASRILTLAALGIFVTIWVSIILLPPRPPRYKRSRTIFMIIQWVLLPITTLCFGALAAINAQTRLMFGKYLDFRVTDKAVKK